MIPGQKSELIIQFVRSNTEDVSLYKRMNNYWGRNGFKQIHIKDSSTTTIICIDPVCLFTSRPKVTQRELVTYFDAAVNPSGKIFKLHFVTLLVIN